MEAVNGNPGSQVEKEVRRLASSSSAAKETSHPLASSRRLSKPSPQSRTLKPTQSPLSLTQPPVRHRPLTLVEYAFLFKKQRKTTISS